MSIESLKNALPEYAKDLKLNLSSLVTEPSLTDEQRAGTFIVAALAARDPTVVEAIVEEFAPKLSTGALNAAKAAAAIMAMKTFIIGLPIWCHRPTTSRFPQSCA